MGMVIGLLLVPLALADQTRLAEVVRQTELGGLRVLSAELVDRGGVPHVRLKVLNEQQRVRVIVRPLFDNDR